MDHSTWESVADEENPGATKLVEKTANGSTFVQQEPHSREPHTVAACLSPHTSQTRSTVFPQL